MSEKQKNQNKKRAKFHLKQAIILAVACGFLLFLYAPLELYFTNITDFWFDLYNIIGIELVMFLLTTAVIFGALFLANLIHPIVYKVLYCAGVVLFFTFYVEGNFLSKDLPLLDGRKIDWQAISMHRVYSILVIVVLTAIIVVLIKIFKYEKTEKYLQYAMLFLSAILLITLCTIGIQKKGFEKKTRVVINKDAEFDFSNDRNVIMVILDAVDADVFEEIIDKKPEYYDTFKDFTFYKNMTSTYTQTEYSVAYLLSGIFLDVTSNDFFADYVAKAFDESVLLQNFMDEGYRIGYYEPNCYPYSSKRVLSFDNVYGADMIKIDAASYLKCMIKLVGFRYAPFDVKQFCVVYYKDFQADERSAIAENYYTDYNDVFLNDIENSEFNITDDKFFKLYHLEGAHIPFEYDEKANKVGGTTYEQCVEASFYVASEFLNKLKENDVYDNSVIILMADHGFSLEDIPEDRLHPVFLVKGINENNSRMVINDEPVSFEDFGDAVEHLKDGAPASEITDWKEGDTRERKCYVFFYKDEGNMHFSECIQKGHAGDWTQVEVVE